MSHCIYKTEFLPSVRESQVTWWNDKSDRAGGAARLCQSPAVIPPIQHAQSLLVALASWETISTLVDFLKLSSGWIMYKNASLL